METRRALACLTFVLFLLAAVICNAPKKRVAVKPSLGEAEALGHEQPRSSGWPKVRDLYLKDHPGCEVCGHTKGLEVHHVRSFRLHPELELDPDNLITLCGEHAEARCKAHYWLGHAGDFKGYNPDVRRDAATMRERWKRSAELAKEADK